MMGRKPMKTGIETDAAPPNFYALKKGGVGALAMLIVLHGGTVGCAPETPGASQTATQSADCVATWTSDQPSPEVSVPGGEFRMGDTLYPEEGPPRIERVGAFSIDRYEVTNAQFARFVTATGHVTVAERPLDPAAFPGASPEALQAGSAVFRFGEDRFDPSDAASWWVFVPGASWKHPDGPGSDLSGRMHQPVVHVALEDAIAYAAWAGRRLPSEIEWEWAARGADPDAVASSEQPSEANTWQGVFPALNTADDGYEGRAPVGCFSPNALGLHDMIGNVWEWTADPYSVVRLSRPGSGAGRDPIQPGVAVSVIKGGSYLCARNYCMRYRPGARHSQDRTLGASHIGFRTVALESPRGPDLN